jgi:8-oxo-dGTP pyrophosphatase MutT (NUDIX family)
LIERDYILRYEFDYLWSHVWQWIGTVEQTYRIQRDYDSCRQKFDQLKHGTQFADHGSLSFQELFKTYPTNKIEPDWEIPKGKRRKGESNRQCAIRECCEETSLDSPDFNVYYHVKPVREFFVGVNSVAYCHTYYLASLNNYNKCLYYDPSHLEQNKEIRKIGWFTEAEIYQLINPQAVNRLQVINQLCTLVTLGAFHSPKPPVATPS